MSRQITQFLLSAGGGGGGWANFDLFPTHPNYSRILNYGWMAVSIFHYFTSTPIPSPSPPPPPPPPPPPHTHTHLLLMNGPKQKTKTHSIYCSPQHQPRSAHRGLLQQHQKLPGNVNAINACLLKLYTPLSVISSIISQLGRGGTSRTIMPCY